MMMRPSLRGLAAFSLLLLLLISGRVAAQTGPEMLIKPWTKDQAVEMLGSTSFFGNTHLRTTDENFQMTTVTSLGRWRVLGDRIESPVVGFEFNHLDNDTASPLIPNHLVDTSLSVGSPVGLIGDHWFVLAIAGVGYAGNSWFADPDALYGTGTILVGKKFDEDRALIIGLDYNGNRSFFPDVPLPGIAYRSLINPRFHYTVGLPFCLAEWNPTDELAMTVRFSLLSRIEASVDYHLIKDISLFSRLVDNSKAFHLDETSGDRRIFFDRKAAEAGLRWSPSDNVNVTAVFGYQFSQNFSRGFSQREADLFAKPADVPYLRFEAQLNY